MATVRSIPGGSQMFWRRAILGAITGLLLIAPLTHAACGRVDQARLRVAAARATAAATSPAGVTAAAADAQAIVASARKRCASAAFAYAVATAAKQRPQPDPGARISIARVDLIAVSMQPGVVWRFDAVRAARTGRALFATGSGASVTWAADPARPAFDAQLQSAVLAALGQRRDGAARTAAAAGARSFATRAHRSAVAHTGLLTHLTIAQRLARTAQLTGDRGVDRAARLVVTGAYRRVAAATGSGGWSRVDGQWSTRTQHRALTSRTTSLLRRYPNRVTTTIVRRLRSQLASGADVRFRSLPSGVFYPWPRDAAFDTQSVTVHVDKPGTATIEIYGAGEAPVQSLSQPVQPGDVPFTWDGSLPDGSIAGPAEYSYVVVVDDVTGRRTRTPGLQSFTIARDTAAPVVTKAAAAFSRAGALGPRIVATWSVTEEISPNVRTQLRLSRAGGKQITILLASTERHATMRRAMKLGSGTWHATFIFTDGSGNVATKDSADLVVR